MKVPCRLLLSLQESFSTAALTLWLLELHALRWSDLHHLLAKVPERADSGKSDDPESEFQGQVLTIEYPVMAWSNNTVSL